MHPASSRLCATEVALPNGRGHPWERIQLVPPVVSDLSCNPQTLHSTPGVGAHFHWKEAHLDPPPPLLGKLYNVGGASEGRVHSPRRYDRSIVAVNVVGGHVLG